MTFLRKWYFPIMCFIALMVYAMQQLGLWLPEWINNYVNDLLCMPIVLKICQYAIRYIKSDGDRTVPVYLQVGLTVCYSIYFEYLLPNYNDRYTTDELDIVLYFLGLVLFQWLERSGLFKGLKD